MSEVWLIDGYNVLCAKSDRQEACSLAHARDQLAHMLSDFAGYMCIKCQLVFDAYRVKGGVGSTTDVSGLTVVYTKEDETADQYIERTCAQIVGQGEVVRVCTNDGMEQHIILGLGGLRMSVRELGLYMDQAIKERKRMPNKPGKQTLFGALDACSLAKLERLRVPD